MIGPKPSKATNSALAEILSIVSDAKSAKQYIQDIQSATQSFIAEQEKLGIGAQAAEKLRAAESMISDAQEKLDAAAEDAQAIVKAAKDEASSIRAKARSDRDKHREAKEKYEHLCNQKQQEISEAEQSLREREQSLQRREAEAEEQLKQAASVKALYDAKVAKLKEVI